MPHRAHLTRVSIASAFRQACLREPYTLARLRADALAGVSVGIIAIPLSMALAIASGVAPQHGLYTAIVAGIVIALTGGSRYSVSGPTAAFVVILYPVSQTFGLAGLLTASLMAAVILIVMGATRLGRLIEYIPPPVTLGFTAGIAVVIATLQIPDFFGLETGALPEFYPEKLAHLAAALPGLDPATTTVSAVTLGVLVIWPRLRLPVPGHLPAVLAGVAVAALFAAGGDPVETIGSRFTFTRADGSLGMGIPAVLPEFTWPWNQPGPGGEPVVWTLERVRALLPAAFSIAALGAIESLLCAVVLDGMTGRRHSANGELLGQGLGNLVAPLFGGITATAAIARSSANYRAGAESPVASVIHALVVLAALVALAPWLAYLPMASMAALLMMVAWQMSEAHKVVRLVRRAPGGDIAVLATCLGLTVVFDMVIAIGVGVVLAALLFMRDVATMTRVTDITASSRLRSHAVPDGWAVFKVTGALFFAAAERVFAELDSEAAGRDGVIVYMDGVPVLDAGGVSALERFVERMSDAGTRVIVADLQFQPLRTLARARIQPVPDRLVFTPTLDEAIRQGRDMSTPGGSAAAL